MNWSVQASSRVMNGDVDGAPHTSRAMGRADLWHLPACHPGVHLASVREFAHAVQAMRGANLLLVA